MSEKKPTMHEYLQGTIKLNAGEYTKARLLELAFGFATEAQAAKSPRVEKPTTLTVITAAGEDDGSKGEEMGPLATEENAALLALDWPLDVIPIGLPSIRLVFAILAWVRGSKNRLDSINASLFSEAKKDQTPKLRKTLSEFSDVICKQPIGDSARWLFTVCQEATSPKAMHEALAQINATQLVADLFKWGLGYHTVRPSTDAALAASMNHGILAILHGERPDHAGSDVQDALDVAVPFSSNEKITADMVHNLVKKANEGVVVDEPGFPGDKGPAIVEIETAAQGDLMEAPKEPDDIHEPHGFGGDLVAKGSEADGVLVREENANEKDVTPPEPAIPIEDRLKGSASSIMKSLKQGFEKLGEIKTLQLADKMRTYIDAGEPEKVMAAVTKLMTIVDSAEEAALLGELVTKGWVTVDQVESVFRDDWMGIYTSLLNSLRTKGPTPPWINDGLLARKTA
jgi:hypothetical protein